MDFDEWLERLICEEAGPHTATFGDLLNIILARANGDAERHEIREFARLAFVFGKFSERKMIENRLKELDEITMRNL